MWDLLLVIIVYLTAYSLCHYGLRKVQLGDLVWGETKSVPCITFPFLVLYSAPSKFGSKSHLQITDVAGDEEEGEVVNDRMNLFSATRH